MKVHKVELVVFDDEEYGIDDILGDLDTAYVLSCKSINIENWDDDHILNRADTPKSVVRDFFREEKRIAEAILYARALSVCSYRRHGQKITEKMFDKLDESILEYEKYIND